MNFLIHDPQSKERQKALGEIFTPIALVDEILDKLPSDLFTDPTKTFIDPAMGDGNFLVRVLERKITNGSTPTQALETTFGVDIMSDNVEECKMRLLAIAIKHEPNGNIEQWERILDQNIVCHDALTYDFSFGRLETDQAIEEPVHKVDPPVQEDRPTTMDDLYSF